ncbi:MAG: hypothetical protein E7514_04945 [Ruminococcaceae bacterium]|nr:hypothetical protein [Oscillospiraceae bacterium]
MKLDLKYLDSTQRIIFSLVPLYSRYGYTPYKMGKFEEYDLYSKNKDFLVSDSVITFTDTNGKLMALKPDVTLSIIKNSDPSASGVQKVYYNENVYRVSKGTNTFKEIPQVGLECIGEVDTFDRGEVLLLAAKSLETLSDSFVLEVSHLGILSAVIDSITQSYGVKKKLLDCVNEKNLHSVDGILKENNISSELAEPLKHLINLYGAPQKVFKELEQLESALPIKPLADEFKEALSIFEGTGLEDRILVDFSAVGDFNYYNGIIFNGFINGVPHSVLSGGQYDNLIKKMKRGPRAIGFAVYLDLLERLDTQYDGYDADVLLVYGDSSDVKEIKAAQEKFLNEGKTVLCANNFNTNLKFREYYKLEKSGVIPFEYNA